MIKILSVWEGVVTEIRKKSFKSLIHNLEYREPLSEVAIFPIQNIPKEDRHLIFLGSPFEWFIGYQKTKTNSMKPFSQIVFKKENVSDESKTTETLSTRLYQILKEEF